MPIYMDRHEFDGATQQDVAAAHVQDLQVQDRFGVRFLTYWFDQEKQSGFCLIDTPDREAAVHAHEASHQNLPNEIIEVDPSTALAFLGRLEDPEPRNIVSEQEGQTPRRTVMFTDIVGSTEMTVRLGDQRAVDMVRAHDALVRRALQDHDGREIKHTGDGIMAVFDAASAAVACAQAIQLALAGHNEESEETIQVSIGMHAGEPVEDSNDLFGKAVQLASRLCETAGPGQIIVSEAVAEACTDRDDFCDLGPGHLKGFIEPIRLIECLWRQSARG